MGDLLFGAFAAISVVSALMVVTRKNPVYSALFLILSFVGIAGIVVLQDATFLAGMHVLVYTGAIMVLFLFVIMMLNLKPDELGGEYPLATKAVVGAISLALFGALAFAFSNENPPLPARPEKFGEVKELGQLMFKKYLFPFELVSVLIIVAIFGAVVLAKRKMPGEDP